MDRKEVETDTTDRMIRRWSNRMDQRILLGKCCSPLQRLKYNVPCSSAVFHHLVVSADHNAAYFSPRVRSYRCRTLTSSSPLPFIRVSSPRMVISPALSGQTPIPFTCWKRTKTTKGQRKRKRKKESEKAKRHNEWRKRERKKKRMKSLHPAAKMKRILSYCDYLFSAGNMQTDYFFGEELLDYHGYVRLSAIAAGEKLSVWGDDPSLIYETLRSEAATKRYDVIINREFIEKATRNRKRRNIRLKEEKKKEKKQERLKHHESKRRKRELERFVESTQSEFFREYLKEESEEMVAEMEKERILQLSKMTATEAMVDRLTNIWEDFNEWILSTKQRISAKVKGGHHDKIDNQVDDEDLDWEYFELLGLDADLCEQNPDFKSAIDELENIYFEEERFHENHKWMRQEEKYFDNIEDSRMTDLRKISRDGKIDLQINAKDHEKDEALPFPVIDDGSDDLYFALVKPKKVELGYFEARGDDSDDIDIEDIDIYDNDIYDFDDENIDDDDDHDRNPKTNTKNTHLQQYTSKRSVRVVRNEKELNTFCRELKESLHATTDIDNNDAPAIGFDVEYCSLEMDIRSTLPAMLQLASPDPKGPVGLIWLDKFPNHGKDMIGDSKCEALISILSSTDISKVGVGITKDAKHLAAWWGITDKDYIKYYVSGMIDIEGEWDDRVNEKGLQEMCESVLERKLPKVKEKNSKQKKKKRKKGKRVMTSHWRCKDLTKQMIQYAADDASCSIDVWRQIRNTTNTAHGIGKTELPAEE